MLIDFDPTGLDPNDAEACDALAYGFEHNLDFQPKDSLIVAALRFFAQCIRETDFDEET
jgi:hypothetical protein